MKIVKRLKETKAVGAFIPKPEMDHINYILGVLGCVEKSKRFIQDQNAHGLSKQLKIARKNGYFNDEDYKGLPKKSCQSGKGFCPWRIFCQGLWDGSFL